MRRTIVCSICWLLLSHWAVAQGGKGLPKAPRPVILGAELLDPVNCVNPCDGVLLISGRELGDTAPFNGEVRLFVPMQGELTLPVLSFDPAAQELAAELPPGVLATPGTFQLTVAVGNQQDEFDVALEVTGVEAGAGLLGGGAAGELLLQIDFGSVAQRAHQHAGEDISSGTVGETFVDMALTRDDEVLDIVKANDGAGSGIDADTLDTLDSTDFSSAGHSHVIRSDDIEDGAVAPVHLSAAVNNQFVDTSGDTVNGSLNVVAGNLAVGTTEPQDLLNVRSDGDGRGIEVSDQSGVEVVRVGQAAGNAGAVNLYQGGQQKISLNAGFDSFFLGGNLGIGTLAPRTPFELRSGVEPQLRISHDPVIDSFLDLSHNGLIHAVNNNNGNLTLRNDGVDGLIIRNSGWVGIGTPSPRAPLEVAGRDNEHPQFIVGNEVFLDHYTAIGHNGSIDAVNGGNGNLTLRNNGVDGLVIRNSGFVGIGTSDPGDRLTVQGVVHATDGFRLPDGTLLTSAPGLSQMAAVKTVSTVALCGPAPSCDEVCRGGVVAAMPATDLNACSVLTERDGCSALGEGQLCCICRP